MNVSLQVTKKQKSFIDADCDEVLFGGAAGGGKSYGQVVDALLFALKYPASKQLVLRRTYAELDKSLIRTAMEIYPHGIFTFNRGSHVGKFFNGSIIDFGYCAQESDVYQYQSAEYDVIRFDELTHFTKMQYIYLLSRVRGTNGFPKQIKSSTNPGGVGHSWVKERFVDAAVPGESFVGDDGMTRIFIPSMLEDNTFLSKGDPGYTARLHALPEKERRALMLGDWNIFDGQYFSEFSREMHVIEPFRIPDDWRKYRALDYGLDRLAVLWIALSPDGVSYVYREFCKSNLTISEAAEAILSNTPENEEIYATLAPPDLWNRTQVTGKSKASIFFDCGVSFTKTSNDRESGWLSIKELLRVTDGGPRLKFFCNCTEIIKCLPALVIDRLKPTDCSNEPHEITHAPDALRGFAIHYTHPNEPVTSTKRSRWTPDMYEDYNSAGSEGRKYLIQKYGEPN